MRGSKVGRFLTEFVVIVVGVLVALGVDEWRENRGERVAEAQYVGRLLADLVADSATQVGIARIGEEKSQALFALIETLSHQEAVRRSPSLGWPDMRRTYARSNLQTTTFEELKNSGGLALIDQEDVRFRIGDHYRRVLHHQERLDQRQTRLVETVAEIYPRIAWGASTTIDLSAAEIDSTFFSAPNVERRLQLLTGAEYQGLVTQELIFARSMREISLDMLDLTTRLLRELRDYQASIR